MEKTKVVEDKLDSIGMTDDDLIIQIQREYDNAINYRRPRIAEWHENEDMLYGRKPVTLSKRSNIDLRLMKGFEDTLLANIKNPPVVKYSPTEEADGRKARKVTALWELESSPTKQDWAFKDLLEKKLALPSGRAVKKIFAKGEPYKHYRESVDHYDFLIDPLAGGLDIEKARYLGQDNIFKTGYDLKNDKTYNQKKVKELIDQTNPDESVEADNEFREKQNRLGILGLDNEIYNAQADGLYKLVEWYTTIKGVRYYCLLSLSKKIILKKRLLEDLVGIHEEDDEAKPLWPFSSWAYYPDIFNFWSPSPMDVVRENFQTRNVVINQAIDNNEAKNKPMKSYDPEVYTNASLLEYQPDRLVPVAAKSDPAKGLYIHPTPDIYDPKLLSEMLEDIASKVTGVTPAGQGVENEDQKVGIYYGNQQEVANRMGLFELSYSRSNTRDALLYLNGLKQFLSEEKAIKMIGENGVEWDKLKKEDLGEFDITITGGSTQAQLDAIKAKQKTEFISRQIKNPIVNQRALIEQDAQVAGFTPQEIKKLLDTNEGNEAMEERASEDIQKIMLSKKIIPFRKADTVYLQKMVDFFTENELEEKKEIEFRIYLQAIEPIVIDNMMKKAQSQLAQRGALPIPSSLETPLPEEAPLPNTPGGTVSQASEITNELKPNYADTQSPF